ncbi:MAG: WhiB family transcriptional regulator [Candidatus Saccharimonadales bacterium]
MELLADRAAPSTDDKAARTVNGYTLEVSRRLFSAHDADWWKGFGKCVVENTEIFFPELGSNGTEAKAICAECEVKAECLAYALADISIQGVWGGTSDKERKDIRKENNKSKSGLAR